MLQFVVPTFLPVLGRMAKGNSPFGAWVVCVYRIEASLEPRLGKCNDLRLFCIHTKFGEVLYRAGEKLRMFNGKDGWVLFFRKNRGRLAMVLQTFGTIEEKKNAFEYEQADSFKDAVDKLVIASANRSYFRGLADGSWKLYSSMQREWITRELSHCFNGSYSNIISEFLKYVYECNSIQLKQCCKVITDISVFSVLQHYGAPTPFIDWTSDWKVALFFASDTDSLCLGNETSSFVSVYWLNVGEGASTFNNEVTSFSRLLEQYKQNLESFLNNYDRSNFDYAEATKFEKWKNLDALWMEESDDEFMKISNQRADLQSGAFIYTKENTKSLEEMFVNATTIQSCKNGGTYHGPLPNGTEFDPHGDGMRDLKEQSKPAPLYLPKIHCLDIHKSFVPQIKKYLNDRGISKKSLGLDSDDWGKKAFQSFLCRDRDEFFLDVDDKKLI